MLELTNSTMEGSSDRFLEVFMDQNNLCNLRCTMCGFSDPRVADLGRYRMPMELFRKIAREVFPHTRYLALSCLTEPLMSRDFVDRLDVLAENPVPFVEMITNGLLLDETIIARILSVPLDRIGISLDGATAETYEAIRRGASFDRLLNRIELLNRMKREAGAERPVLRLDYVISETNLHEFEDFLALAEKLLAGAVDIRTIVPMNGAPDQGTNDREFWDTVRRYRARLVEWTAATGIEDCGYLRDTGAEIILHDEKGRKQTCQRPWTTAAVHWNGDVQICSSWMRPPVGNLARQSFQEIWNGEELAAVRRDFEAREPGIDCQHCQIKKNSPDDQEDGFYGMLAKSPVELS